MRKESRESTSAFIKQMKFAMIRELNESSADLNR